MDYVLIISKPNITFILKDQVKKRQLVSSNSYVLLFIIIQFINHLILTYTYTYEHHHHLFEPEMTDSSIFMLVNQSKAVSL